ncbi:MAG: holo-ACP synthase [Chloroflexota bacterium]
MKIHQGIDIVAVAKLRDIARRHPGFVRDMFTDREKVYCESRKDRDLHLAGRFAAKESYLKALGTGFPGAGIDRIFREIEVVPNPAGRPEIVVDGWAARLSRKKKITQCSVSITHAGEYAVAAVILVAD